MKKNRPQTDAKENSVEADEVVAARAEADLFRVGELFRALELLSRLRRGVPAGGVDGDRVERGEHADVMDAGRHGARFAVASARDVHGERDVEIVLAVVGGVGVFDELFAEEAAAEEGVFQPGE